MKWLRNLNSSLPFVLKVFIPVSMILCVPYSLRSTDLQSNAAGQASGKHNRQDSEREKTRTAAELSMREAERLRQEFNFESNRAAEKKYQEALRLSHSIDDSSAIAATLRSIGELLQDRGDRQGALAYLNESLLASRKARD